MPKAHDAIMVCTAVDSAPELSCAPSLSSLKAFCFPKRQFAIGSMGKEGSFHTERCDVPGSCSSTVHSLLSTKATISITA